MRVRAIAPGFFDINKDGHPVDIKVGQEFDYPDDRKPGKWFVPVEAAKPAAPPTDPKKTPNK